MNSFWLSRTLRCRRCLFYLRFSCCFLCFLGKHFRLFFFSFCWFSWRLLRLFDFLIFFLYRFCFLSWLFFILRDLLDSFLFDIFYIFFGRFFFTLCLSLLLDWWCILNNLMILGPFSEFVEFRLRIQYFLWILRAYLCNCLSLLWLLFLLTFLHKTE